MNEHWKLKLSIFLVAVALLAGCAPRAEAPFRDYYVSPTGVDSPGNGTESRPWQTIQYAHDHADYSGRPVQLHIAAGTYTENLRITNSLILRGAGAGDPLADTGLTVIEWATPPAGRDAAHIISGTDVEVYDLVFVRGRVGVTGGRFVAENVWFHRISGLFGLQLQDVGAFSVVNSEFRTQFRVYADYGINILNSTGEVLGGYFGDFLDHAINIARYPEAPVMVVTVDGTTVRGSPVCYADGIRVSGAPIVNILNSDIQRLHSDSEPACTVLGGPIVSDGVSAGIGFQRVPTSGGVSTHTLTGNTVSGFDMGMAFDVRRTRVKAEGNNIAGLTYGVLTWRWPDASSSAGTTLDFGNGPLGSAGGNIFQNTGAYAFYHDEDYEVSACGNDWNVPDSQIDPDRIFDRLDDPTHGRVMWTCTTSEPIVVGPTETLAQIWTSTPGDIVAIITTDARCRTGPGFVYGDYDFFTANQTALVYARVQDSSWYQVQAPNLSGKCWIGQAVLQFDVNTDILLALPVLLPPATPTPTLDPDEGSDDGGQEEGGGQGGSAPAAPSKLQASENACNANKYEVLLTWKDNSDNESGFRIYHNGQLVATVGANSTKHIYAVPSSWGQQQSFTVEAYNNAGPAKSNTATEDGCIY